MTIIQAKSLTKRFEQLTAVDQLSMTVNSGEIFGLVGPDGAGKTTTMRLLASLMEPDGGDAWVDGFHIVKEAETVKEHIGYMSQKFGLYPDLSVMENIEFYADIYEVPKVDRPNRIARLLDFSNLGPFSNRYAEHLSGGMKQKLALMCALIHTPKILFLDEPTSGVDPISRRDFWRILYELHRKEVTIFVSTSYMDEAERCNRVGFLNEGKLLACGTPQDLKSVPKRKIIEIVTETPRRSLIRLRDHYSQRDVRLFGSHIHLSALEPKKESKKIVQLLGDVSIRMVTPSMEDVFISLLSRSDA